MGAPDCPVRQPRHPTVRVTDGSDRWSADFMSHRTVWCRTGQLLFSVRCALTLRCDSDTHYSIWQ
jgi:hypothetical protein